MNSIRTLCALAVAVAIASRPVSAQDAQLEKREIQLPAPVANTAVGGNGRYLAMHFPELRQVGVFDLEQEEITFFVRLLEDHVLFAADRESLIVITRESRLLQRWNLATGQREQEAAFPIDGALKTIAMGAGSSGPLLVFHADNLEAVNNAHYSLMDLKTLKVTPIEGVVHNKSYRDIVHIRASSDGKVFGMWCTSHTPTGMVSVRIKGRQATTKYQHDSVGHVVPGARGEFLFTKSGVFTSDLQSAPHEGVTERSFCVPAVTGPMFVQLEDEQFKLRAGDKTIATAPVNLRISNIDERWSRSDMTMDKRVVLAPEVNRLAYLPIDRPDVIEVFSLGGEAMTKSVGVAGLRVTSDPPIEAKTGEQLQYRIETTAADADLKYELSASPDGMQVSPDGVITWTVPASYDRITARVILIITDAEGQALQHGFVMRVGR
jgi:hypothetical protein